MFYYMSSDNHGMVCKISVLEDFERIVGASKKYVAGGQQQGRKYLYKYLPSTQDEPPARRMAVS